MLQVRVGVLEDGLEFQVGYLTYQSMWDDPLIRWGAIGAGAGLLLIIIITIVVCLCSKK